MSVPDYQTFMRPVLEALEGEGVVAFRTLCDQMADHFHLTDADRAQTIETGYGLLPSRVGWAVTYLVKAGAVRRPRRATAEITDRGRGLLVQTHGPISNDDLMQFAEFRDFRQRGGSRRKSRETLPRPTPPDIGVPRTTTVETLAPAEVIADAVHSHRTAVTGDLLDRVMELSPTAYERLVLRLLEAMGYGKFGRIESTAKTGDAGIDGVISQDPLGLDRIYVQAKRYARDRTVGRPLMQEFVGALHGQQADRGVFMTTCSFTREALDYAERVGARIIPVDGDEMAALLLRNGVGVQPDYTAVLHRIDEDFFETLEG